MIWGRLYKSSSVAEIVCEQFEKETRHEVRSMKHNVPNFGKDFDDVIKTLSEENILFLFQIDNMNHFHLNVEFFKSYLTQNY